MRAARDSSRPWPLPDRGGLAKQDNSANNAYRQLANTVILVSLPIAGCTLAAGIAATFPLLARITGPEVARSE